MRRATTPITTPFDATTTALDVVEGVDLSGRTAVVTGAASGIGVETARALAATGARITLAVRDADAGRRVAADIAASTGNDAVRVAALDLADLESVDAFTAAWHGPLHALVNNAGVMHTPERRTRHGWELQFATNHLGHFALATGLRDALAVDGGARIVSLSSSGHDASPVVFDDLMFDRRPYDPGLAYGQSKTANVLFAVEATRRWRDAGIFANAVMPGGIWTALQRHWDPARRESARTSRRGVADGRPMKTPEQGAATSVLVATSPLLEASAAGTSRTAARPPSSRRSSTGCTASAPTPWTRPTRAGCGTSRSNCSTRPAAPAEDRTVARDTPTEENP